MLRPQNGERCVDDGHHHNICGEGGRLTCCAPDCTNRRVGFSDARLMLRRSRNPARYSSVPESEAKSTPVESSGKETSAPEKRSVDEMQKDTAASTTTTAKPPTVEPVTKSVQKKVPQVQVLHRNLGEDDFVFDAEGINVLVGEPENGMRKGWKIEARTWRWATEVPKVV